MNDNAAAHLRILLVEDSSDDAQWIAHQLEQDGLVVEYQRVDNESDFMAALAWTPDLVLSDYSMPQFNGPRSLQILKERAPHIPFVLISGTVGEDIAVQAIKAGADDYIMKDRPARLASAIRHALEQKSQRTDRILADQALHENEARLRAIIETSPDGTILTDLNGKILMANQQSAFMHGFESSKDMTGARRLRSSTKRALTSVPIIAVTVNALKGDAEKALDAGCDVYMSKPINIRELWARVEAFVPAPR